MNAIADRMRWMLRFVSNENISVQLTFVIQLFDLNLNKSFSFLVKKILTLVVHNKQHAYDLCTHKSMDEMARTRTYYRSHDAIKVHVMLTTGTFTLH